MPMSIDPPPAEDEIECARCGAHFHDELTRCPNCGVNVYEPDDEELDGIPAQRSRAPQRGIVDRIDTFIRQFTRKPYQVDELFGASINQAELFNDLLVKVGGDRVLAERLIDFERQQNPGGNRMRWLESAIQRWERDNRIAGGK